MALGKLRPLPMEAPLTAGHVNMMTDSIIINMPADGLRTIIRGLLGMDPAITSPFHALATDYLAQTIPSGDLIFFTADDPPIPAPFLAQMQSRYRCLMGCGFGFACLEILGDIVHQLELLDWQATSGLESLLEALAVVDADIVQAVTAVQKGLSTENGVRTMANEELCIVLRLRDLLLQCRSDSVSAGHDFPFERGLSRLERLDGVPRLTHHIIGSPENAAETVSEYPLRNSTTTIETFQLAESDLPRIFMGLWQFASSAWGTASKSKINEGFKNHVGAGLIAYDMADHYGDAEVTFGQFRSYYSDPAKIFCATKYCVFEPITLTEDVVAANISERLLNTDCERIDLLQLHWQSYDDAQYIKMAKLVEADPRVKYIGLCNFDTQHMDEIIESGVKIVSNQVQFSLVDIRPTFKMAESCRKHNIKLLAYGTLCGGFLADKWLGKPAPNLYEKGITPSHRKYFEMIRIWGGWILFQELLVVLAAIGKKHGTSISNVACRWILDHDYVGAVMIGARMGISDNIEDNLRVFSFRLDSEDKAAIASILERSNAETVFKTMGDCGAEYRS